MAALLLALALALVPAPAFAQERREPTSGVLVQPMKDLFSHRKHAQAFSGMGVQCIDCHRMSIKPESPGPLAPPVPAGLLKPAKKVCHECHLGKVAMPVPNQCAICHVSSDAIMPKDHLAGWRYRHGKLAQMDRDACSQCHTQQSCSKCHSQVDTMNPRVHVGNFRLFHSIQARGNPQSCIQCHKSMSFCLDCHTGGLK